MSDKFREMVRSVIESETEKRWGNIASYHGTEMEDGEQDTMEWFAAIDDRDFVKVAFLLKECAYA